MWILNYSMQFFARLTVCKVNPNPNPNPNPNLRAKNCIE